MADVNFAAVISIVIFCLRFPHQVLQSRIGVTTYTPIFDICASPNEAMDSIPDVDLTKCTWNCVVHEPCENFNYNNLTRQCDLFFDKPTNFSATPNCSHFQLLPEDLKPRDCYEWMTNGFTRSGLYAIYLDSNEQNKIAALCDMDTDGGGWTIFQRRHTKSSLEQEFVSWSKYEDGIGIGSAFYWMGNRLLNVVTSGQPQEMRIEVTDVNGSEHHVTYSNFTVDGPQNFYRLKVGGFLTGCSWTSYTDTYNTYGSLQPGISTLAECQALCLNARCRGIDIRVTTLGRITCWVPPDFYYKAKPRANSTHYAHICTSEAMGNILRYNNGQNFSTPDRDHDNNTQLNCGSLYQSGWWHNQCSPTPSVNSDCLSSNLNGRYSADPSTSSFWATWDCTRVYLTGSEMKFRPMQPTDGYQEQVVEVSAPLVPRMKSIFPKIKQSTASVTCDPDYLLLSCGMSPVNFTMEEAYPKFYPTIGACYCYNSYGSNCQAWCTDSVQGVEYVSTVQQSGVFTVMCPAGKKLLGCHISPNDIGTSSFDRWRQFYPINDSTCTCSDSVSASCIASCASNVINHEIIRVNGSRYVWVSCPPGKVVLGCGQAPYPNLGPYKYRITDIGNSTSCYCYDLYGTLCYAVCGNFA